MDGFSLQIGHHLRTPGGADGVVDRQKPCGASSDTRSAGVALIK
ncbi:hypothetical protein [Corynebacterium durum]|nr:hypothetical protein [Corynebacterium durum]